MGCGLVAVIRRDQRHHLLFAALVYGVCQFPAQVTAEPPPVMTTSVVSELGDAAAPVLADNWFLQAMWALLHQGRAAEAYQLGQIALTAHADSTELILALAYAAEASGRCILALHHLAELAGSAVMTSHRRRAELIQARCSGPWRREVTFRLATGYRQSLVDRARLVSLRLQPGSAAHGLCVRLRGLCDPNTMFRLEGAPASGIDIWTQLSLGHLFRDGGDWDFSITPEIFVRSPRRNGYRGDGVSLRVEAQRHLEGGKQVRFLLETGGARFQQGDAARSIAQRHRKLEIGFVMPHGDLLASHLGHHRHRVVSGWLDLHRRVTDLRLVADRGGMLSGWAQLAVERSSQGGPGLMPGSRARDHAAGVGLRLGRVQIGFHQFRRSEKFAAALPYLAAPHHARTRQTGMTLAPDLGRRSNLKFVLSFQYRKISSPDPYRPRSTKNLFLTVKYKFKDRPGPLSRK